MKKILLTFLFFSKHWQYFHSFNTLIAVVDSIDDVCRDSQTSKISPQVCERHLRCSATKRQRNYSYFERPTNSCSRLLTSNAFKLFSFERIGFVCPSCVFLVEFKNEINKEWIWMRRTFRFTSLIARNIRQTLIWWRSNWTICEK